MLIVEDAPLNKQDLPIHEWQVPDDREQEFIPFAALSPYFQQAQQQVEILSADTRNLDNFRPHLQPRRGEQVLTCNDITLNKIQTTALFDKNPDGSSRNDRYVIQQWTESIPENCIPVIVTRITNPADGSTHAVITFLLNSDYQKRLGADGYASSQAYDYHFKATWYPPSGKYPDNFDADIRSAGFDQMQPFSVEENINGQLRKFTLRPGKYQLHVKLASNSTTETQIDWGVNISPDRKPNLNELITHMVQNYRVVLNDNGKNVIQFPVIYQNTTPIPNREELSPILDELVSTPTPQATYTPTPLATFTPKPDITSTPLPPDQVFALNEGIAANFEPPANKVYLNLAIHGTDQLTVYDITEDDLTKKLEEKLSSPSRYQLEIPGIANKLASNANSRGLINTANFFFHLGNKKEYDSVEAQKLSWKNLDTQLLIIHQIQQDQSNILVACDEKTGRKYLIYTNINNTDMMTFAAYDNQLNYLPVLSMNLQADMLNTVNKIRVGNRPEMMDIRDSAFIVPTGYSHALRGLSFDQARQWLDQYLAPISGTQTIYVQDKNGNSYPLQVNTGLLINNPRLVRGPDGTYRIYGKLSTFGQRTMDQAFFENINKLFGSLNVSTLDVVIDPSQICVLDYKPQDDPAPTPTFIITPTPVSQVYPTSLTYDPSAKSKDNQLLSLMRNRLSQKMSLRHHNYKASHGLV